MDKVYVLELPSLYTAGVWLQEWGPWLVIVALLGYAYRASKKHKLNAVSQTAAQKGRDWFKYLRLTFWYKPRGFVMNRKKRLERERLVRDLISYRQLMVIEMAWYDGEISNEEYKKYTDDLAFRFSNPALFKKGRMKHVKMQIKRNLEELKNLKPLPFPDLKKGEGETETKKSPLLVKAA
jgi:hypothetical protein